MKKQGKKKWGGARPGAGRPKDPNSGAPHLARPRVRRRDQVLLSFELSDAHPLASNTKARLSAQATVREAVQSAHGRFGFRVDSWAITSEKLVVYGSGATTPNLSRAAQGLGVRVARRVNSHLGTSGKLFADRYRLTVL